MKRIIKEYFPGFFQVTRSIKNQLQIELGTMKTVGVHRLVFLLVSRSTINYTELPVQKIKSITIEGINFDNSESLGQLLRESESGAHSYYLDPTKWKQSKFSPLQRFYPNGCGIKIRKTAGDKYSKGLSIESRGRIQGLLAESHPGQLLVANYLYAMGVSPRLYDIVEIDGGESKCVAIIVEHVDQVNSDKDLCHSVVEAIRQKIDAEFITLVNWNGFSDGDFECPGCNGNLRISLSGEPRYVDTQNFSVGRNFKKYLLSVTDESRGSSHFGDESKILGGKYLYQKIPGINRPAKRDTGLRSAIMDKMLESSGLCIEDGIVIDVGCNLGLMGGEYLKRLAHWVHGVDLPEVVKEAEKISLAIGLTRYSYFGCVIDKDINLLSGAPSFYRNENMTLWISYLSIRGHVGWVDHLKDLNWSYMLYEGHENEDLDFSRKCISNLNDIVPLEIISESWVADGTSGKRYFAIIKRNK